MTDTIKLHYLTSPPTTINNNKVTLAISSSGAPSYNGTIVNLVEATLDSLTLEIEALGTSLTMNGIRATASAQNATSWVKWEDNGSSTNPGLDITIETPLVSLQEVLWSFGENVPPVRLTVKIVRR